MKTLEELQEEMQDCTEMITNAVVDIGKEEDYAPSAIVVGLLASAITILKLYVVKERRVSLKKALEAYLLVAWDMHKQQMGELCESCPKVSVCQKEPKKKCSDDLN